MGKRLAKGILAVCLLLMISGCSFSKNDSEKKELQIKRIEVCSAAQNADGIYHVKYPYCFYTFSADKCSRHDLNEHVECKDLPQEKAKYFVDYISSLPDSSDYENGENVAYYVYLTYENADGAELDVYKIGYDEFPEGWETFIDNYNEILGRKFLTGEGRLQTVTPEFLTDVFGVTDEDVKEGTLQDVIDVMGLDMAEVTDLFYMDDALDEYYAFIRKDEIEPYRPKELVSVESTQEEYDAFVKKYLDAVGLDQSAELESDQEHFRRFYDEDRDLYFYIARTAEMDQLPVFKGWDEYYTIGLDMHMEGMTCEVDFVYSADQKFLLAPDDSDEEMTDMILIFCGLQ